MNADAVSLGAGPDFRPRSSDGWGLGSAMAVGVHLMLVAALALGVRWKMSTPQAVEAEVWAEIPRVAAPRAAAPPPAQPEPPVVTPPPVVAPPAPPTPPKQAEPEPAPERQPDIVAERTPPKKDKKEKKRKEPVEVFETEPPKPIKKSPKAEKTEKADKPDKTPPPKVAQARPEPQPEVKKAPPGKGAVSDAQAKALERDRQARLQSMMSELGSLGTSSRSAGPSASYGGRIRARVKPNIVFTDVVSGNPLAVVEVRCAPDGRIIARKLIEPSGSASWDEAVLRAIDRTEVLPADENGRVPATMQLEFRPKDF